MFKYSHVPAYSFGKSTKPNGSQALPGPGAYDPDKADKLTRKIEATSVKIKPSHEPDFHSKSKVGPGQYNLPDDNWKAPTAKFPHEDRGKWRTSAVPGPGQYDFDQTEARLKSEKKNIVFPKASRMTEPAGMPKIPGPGQYDTVDMSTRVERYRAKSGYKFDRSTRDGMYKARPVPGPGTYDSKTDYVYESNGRGYSLGKSTGGLPLFGKNVPGPGAYDPNMGRTAKNIKFGKNERAQLDSAKKIIPGPGQYDADQVYKKLTSQPGIKFSKSEPLFKENRVPGPGNYDPKVSAIEKRAVPFLKEERGRMVSNAVPGPGQYENNLDMSTKVGRFKFGREPRGKEQIPPVPGPGAYDAKVADNMPCYKMPKQVRLKDHTSFVPGPGNYNYDPKLWDKHFPKFGHATSPNPKGLPVGPGLYNIPGTIPDVPRYNYPGYETRKIKI